MSIGVDQDERGHFGSGLFWLVWLVPVGLELFTGRAFRGHMYFRWGEDVRGAGGGDFRAVCFPVVSAFAGCFPTVGGCVWEETDVGFPV